MTNFPNAPEVRIGRGQHLYPNDLARKMYHGEPFRPSNATEGDLFHSAFCAGCHNWQDEFEEMPACCDIHTRVMAFDVIDHDYPAEWIHNQDGQPVCTAFKDKNKELFPDPCPLTLDLFAKS